MSTLPLNGFQPMLPTEAESQLATETNRRLVTYLNAKHDLQVRIVDEKKQSEETLTIPASAARLLSNILTEMAQGNGVRLRPIHPELTTDEAAEILNVSLPFLIGLLDEGKIPSRKVGIHRRVLLTDLMDYKRKSDERCHQALDELTALTEEMGLY